MSIATLLEKLITKKFYTNKEDIENKIDVFYAMGKVSDTDYSNLVLKVKEMYETPIEETPEEDKPVEIAEESEEE